MQTSARSFPALSGRHGLPTGSGGILGSDSVREALTPCYYRRFADLPDWSDRELGELHGRLQQYVIASLEMARIVKARLRWGD